MTSHLAKPARKGQFFMISAVIILMTFYSIVSALNSNWQTDVSEVRGNAAAIIFENIESGLNKIIAKSPAADMKRNLDSFVIVEKKAIGNEYSLNIFFNISATDVIANSTLSSKKFYAEKAMMFKRP